MQKWYREKTKTKQNTCKNTNCAAVAFSFALGLHFFTCFFKKQSYLMVGHVWLPSLNITLDTFHGPIRRVPQARPGSNISALIAAHSTLIATPGTPLNNVTACHRGVHLSLLLWGADLPPGGFVREHRQRVSAGIGGAFLLLPKDDAHRL